MKFSLPNISHFRQGRRYCGLRIAALVETLIFLSAIVLFNRWFGDGTRFVSISPHPFTLIVLLVAVQYGTIDAIVATVLATLFLYAGNVPPQRLSETLFEYQFRLAIMPLIWFCSSFIFGELRMRWQHEQERVETAYNTAKKQGELIAKEYEYLKQAKENLEAALATQRQTSSVIYTALQSLENVKPAKVLLSLGHVVKIALNPIKFSLYVQGENGLEVATNEGWESGDDYALRIVPDNPIYIELVLNRRTLCVINDDDELIMDGEGVLAGPLIDPDSGSIFGMIKIEEIDFFTLNINTIASFKSLLELIGLAYANARRYDQRAQQSIYDMKSSYFSYSMFQTIAPYICSLSGSHPPILVTIKVQQSAEKRSEVDTRLQQPLKELFPEPALLCNGRRSGELLIIAPQIKIKEAEKRCQNLSALLTKDKSWSDITLKFEVETLTVAERNEQHNTRTP